MKKSILSAALCVLSVCAMAQTEERSEKLDSVVVSASRAGASTPVTFTMVSQDALRAAAPSASLPMALSLQPSVVVSNEGGTGLGYSSLTIRGSKGTQINVTLNGITLNDSESQEVFWVNIPSLSSLLSSVQIQRGLGTGAGGTGAFGANINMSTASVSAEPHVLAEIGYGSYRTRTVVASASTGLLPGGFYASAAYTRGDTEGYIRNAWARVQSALAVVGWMKGPRSLRLTYLMGSQHSGITWNGISLEDYARDPRYNSAGEYVDANGNVQYYSNESDNYTQHHLQLNYTRSFSAGWFWTTTLNWTGGSGYYEQYKAGKKFTKYGWAPDAMIGGIPAKTKADFVIRKGLENGYLVGTSELKYNGDGLRAVAGLSVSRYSGSHYGEVLRCSLLPQFDFSPYNVRGPENNWYYNTGLKKELDVFARAEYDLADAWTLYGDVMFRGIDYTMGGTDDEDHLKLDGTQHWRFFQPRAGVSWHPDAAQKLYASVSLGAREPGRSDLKEVIESQNLGGNLPDLKPEKMVDIELGYSYAGERFSGSAGIYLMEYRDMLLETGRLSDSGHPIKNNVDRAYRRGIELCAAWKVAPWLRLEGNTTLSVNRILSYEDSAAVIDDQWNELGYSTIYARFDATPIRMSPAFIGMARASVRPFCNARNSLSTTTLSFDVKGVGKQYLDNTGDPERTVPAYAVCNLTLSHEFNIRPGKLGLSLYVNNLFNRAYYTDGGVWKYWNRDSERLESGVWIYPQAMRNASAKVYFRF